MKTEDLFMKLLWPTVRFSLEFVMGALAAVAIVGFAGLILFTFSMGFYQVFRFNFWVGLFTVVVVLVGGLYSALKHNLTEGGEKDIF